MDVWPWCEFRAISDTGLKKFAFELMVQDFTFMTEEKILMCLCVSRFWVHV